LAIRESSIIRSLEARTTNLEQLRPIPYLLMAYYVPCVVYNSGTLWRYVVEVLVVVAEVLDSCVMSGLKAKPVRPIDGQYPLLTMP